jgi:hypothetical protein
MICVAIFVMVILFYILACIKDGRSYRHRYNPEAEVKLTLERVEKMEKMLRRSRAKYLTGRRKSLWSCPVELTLTSDIEYNTDGRKCKRCKRCGRKKGSKS